MEQKIFLLADDDIDDRELFCEALKAIDGKLVCHAVTNGGEALDSLGRTIPQLIFLDVNMPVMDGWECLKKIMADERYRHIPVIIISTSSHQREIAIARELGALCYFTKPHHFNELTEVLRVIAAHAGSDLAAAVGALGGKESRYVHVLQKEA